MVKYRVVFLIICLFVITGIANADNAPGTNMNKGKTTDSNSKAFDGTDTDGKSETTDSSAAGTPSSDGTFEVECIYAVNPNVIKVDELDRVRLVGIESPSEEGVYYNKALKLINTKLKGKTVKVELAPGVDSTSVDVKDATVYYKKGKKWKDIARDLLIKGYCKIDIHDDSFANITLYREYQEKAKSKKKGVWKKWSEDFNAEEMENEFGKIAHE